MLNGLQDSMEDSWDDAFGKEGFSTWEVGIELRIPLGGGKKTRSELEAAKYRKKQALLEIKSLEVSVANEVDTAIKDVYSTREQVRQYSRVVDLNKRLLEVELLRHKGGKSNSRLVLEREAELHIARDRHIESEVENKMAIIALETAKGSLLKIYGIDIMEDNVNGQE